MKLSPKFWMQAASFISCETRADWMRAMEAELGAIETLEGRKTFAAGCFQAALYDFTRSRRGLSIMARGGGAVLALLMSGYVFGVALKWIGAAETAAMGMLIAGLSLYYAVCAALLWASLRRLQIFAISGFGAAVCGHIYFRLLAPQWESLSPEFLQAVSLEMAGLMTGFFIAGAFLLRLYDPKDSQC